MGDLLILDTGVNSTDADLFDIDKLKLSHDKVFVPAFAV